jgi:hypothetical protein
MPQEEYRNIWNDFHQYQQRRNTETEETIKKLREQNIRLFRLLADVMPRFRQLNKDWPGDRSVLLEWDKLVNDLFFNEESSP